MSSPTADRVAPLAVALAAFVLWWFALPPDVQWWDTAEAQTVPYMLGIFHPTGFPAYTLAGWFFSHVFAIGNVAWRMSAFTALCGAAACGCLVRAARTLGVAWPIATASGLALATTRIIFVHATRAGVETMVLACVAFAIFAALERRPVFAAGAAAVAIATHTVAIWFVPGLAVLWYTALRDQPRRARAVAMSALAFAAGCALYLYLPVRSAIVTALRLDPTATIAALDYHPWWNYDNPATVNGFVRLVSGEDFHAAGALAAAFDPAHLGGSLVRLAEIAASSFTVLGAFAAVIGTAVMLRERAVITAGLLLCIIGPIPFSLSYGMLDDAAKYYLVAAWVSALLLSLAIKPVQSSRIAQAAATVALGALAIAGGIAHRDLFAQRDQHLGAAVIAATLAGVPDGALVCAPWYYATPLAYAAYVEHRLGRRLPCTNIENGDGLARLAATRSDVYFFPIPATDVVKEGVRLIPVPGIDPPLYHVIAGP